MKQLKLKTRLLILVGVGFVILIITGIISFSTFQKVQNLKAESEAINQIETYSLKLRKHEKDFLTREVINPTFFETGDSKYLSKFKSDLFKIDSILVALEKSSTIKKNNLNQLLLEMKNSFKTYENDFSVIVEAIKVKGFKDWGLVGELRNNVRTIEASIKNNQLSDRINAAMLTLRRNEKDYLIRKDLSYQEKLNVNSDKLRRLIKLSNSISLSLKTDLEKLLDDYINSFNRVVELDKKIGLSEGEGNMGDLRNTIHKIEPQVIQLSSKVDIEIQRIIHRSEVVLALSIVIGLIASLIIGLYITMQIMRQLGGEPSEVEQISADIANGNLNLNIDDIENRVGAIKSMITMVSTLREITAEINNGANNIVSASQQMSSSSEELSQGANEQASSIEEVSSTMEQISSNIEQNTQNALQTEKVSQKANKSIKEVADKSQKAVDANKEIAEKITIISDISFQTNILALNAAVEAARAGEHGKGFAVVAAEVRKLAEKSKIAAEEIVSLAQTGLKLTEEASEVMLNTLPEIENTSNLVQEISAASLEQNNGAGQVNSAIQLLNSVTQQNASASEELASTAEELAGQAEQLRQLISFFNTDQQYHSSETNTHRNNQSKSNTLINIKPNSNKADNVVNFDIDIKADNDFTNF